MAVTIVAYQGLGAPFSIESGGGRVTRGWDPSDDMRRDQTHENKALLMWMARGTPSNLQVRVTLESTVSALIPGSHVIEDIIFDGGSSGFVGQTVFTSFFSSRAAIGNNRFHFEVVAGGGSIEVSDHIVMYKRLVEGV